MSTAALPIPTTNATRKRSLETSDEEGPSNILRAAFRDHVNPSPICYRGRSTIFFSGSTATCSARLWSENLSEDDPSTVYTFQVIFGKTPSRELDPWYYLYDEEMLKDMLERRKLPTHGTKADLLHRVRYHLPYIVLLPAVSTFVARAGKKAFRHSSMGNAVTR